MQEFEEMKRNYQEIEIPDELEFFVRRTIREQERKIRKNRDIKRFFAATAASLVVFAGTVNLSPAAAETLSEVPGMKNLVHLVLVKNWVRTEKGFEADIRVPAVEGLGDVKLEDSLNKKYREEGASLYREFERQMGHMKEVGSEHFAVSSDYEVVAESEDLITIRRLHTSIAASGYQRVDFDTIDKKKKLVLTLPALFVNEDYVPLISENIKEQMRQQMQFDAGKVYFLDRGDSVTENFDQISKDQKFYINKEGRLVIAFDEYEVAPGSMGRVEFEIPTELIRPVLAGDRYIR